MKKTHLLMLLIFLFSCKKEKQQNNQFVEPPLSARQEAKIVFSKTLAIALEKEPSLRAFIKSEALKMFDNDYDVLLQMVLGKDLGQETVSEILFKHAPSKVALQDAIESLPTLTIMVPEVPNFTAETWNTASEIPMVAVAPESKHFNSIDLYNAKLEVTKAPYGLVPGFPVVVVKENERVAITVPSASLSSKKTSTIMNYVNSGSNTTQKYNFHFLDPAFDGTSKNSKGTNTNVSVSSKGKTSLGPADSKISRIVNFPTTNIIDYNYFSLDQRVVEAFNKNVEWQRDYVYYGIDPAAGVVKGKFNNRYVEHIVSLKINKAASDLSDSPEDPVNVETYQKHKPPAPFPKLWTDGAFEIRINILINAKAGAGPTLEKIFSIPGDLLYDVVYQQVPNSINWYRVSSTPKEYKLLQPEPIVAWDLENYSSQWKFVVSEFDNATTVTNIHTYSTKFATNFNFDVALGEKVKVGAKYGSSTEETEVRTHQIVTTLTSDQLGEGILEFASPIILRREDNVPYDPYANGGRPPRDNPNGPWFVNRYITNDISGGSITLSVEPKYR
ncbi:hypothetical protein SAMN04487898_104338 [Pedobacter sp. ok626]|uniref:hypothetical protein n=1 Tax=Pedobacter sp. ok626 TaxID=1761882 RepID=UPI00088E539F|nr:hypothetical protein [Pedobacter sp. ok626]SDJ81304.1 hypothetical protein SAMN04487898_104338 [Pedobacter sp. ok626]